MLKFITIQYDSQMSLPGGSPRKFNPSLQNAENQVIFGVFSFFGKCGRIMCVEIIEVRCNRIFL